VIRGEDPQQKLTAIVTDVLIIYLDLYNHSDHDIFFKSMCNSGLYKLLMFKISLYLNKKIYCV